MSANDCSVTCAANLEWTNAQGVKIKSVKYKTATLGLARNESRQIFLQIESGKKAENKFLLKDIKVLNRFMNEGKSSIQFPHERCTVFLSNAPVAPLLNFFKLILVKLSGKDNESTKKQSNRMEILKDSNNLQDISPVTKDELTRTKEKARKAQGLSVTTPSPSAIRKRKMNELNDEYSGPRTPKIPRGKRLNMGSPSTKIGGTTEEQQRILDAVLGGQNIFFTGSAGTGKSYLLKKIIAALPPNVTAVTASTGVAACHIGGTTLHRFAGIGLGTGDFEECRRLALRSSSMTNWKKIKHLIIDEISMVEGDYFEKIEALARDIRRNDKPFGGLQLILCGDFFQLPPVGKRSEKVKFCFQSEAWSKCVQLNFELKTVHRQTDPLFIDLLNNLRIGRITDEFERILKDTSSQQIESDGILATRLCSHVNEANEINQAQLDRLTGESKIYNAEDSDKAQTSLLDRDTPVPSKLVLKVGAQVMLLKNVSVGSGLTNGARGVVVKFVDNLPIVHFKTGEHYKVKSEKWSVRTSGGSIIYRKQIPLKLAWAFSIHKSQGLTLDCVEMSLSRVFDAGQSYVALSRAQSLKALRVLDFETRQVWANQEVLKFHNRLQRQLSCMEMIPLSRKR